MIVKDNQTTAKILTQKEVEELEYKIEPSQGRMGVYVTEKGVRGLFTPSDKKHKEWASERELETVKNKDKIQEDLGKHYLTSAEIAEKYHTSQIQVSQIAQEMGISLHKRGAEVKAYKASQNPSKTERPKKQKKIQVVEGVQQGVVVEGIGRISTTETKPIEIDMIHQPPHYQGKNGLEAIKVVEGFMGDLSGMSSYYWGNSMKYLLRFQKKNGLEDLKKAKQHLEWLIKEFEKEAV